MTYTSSNNEQEIGFSLGNHRENNGADNYCELFFQKYFLSKQIFSLRKSNDPIEI